jgi:cell division transport system permease protein
MKNGTDLHYKARTRTAGVSTVIGIALVLFMLGVLGFLVLNAQALERYFKENVRVELFLKRDLKEVDVMQFRKELDTEAYHARNPLRDGGRGGGTAEAGPGRGLSGRTGEQPVVAFRGVAVEPIMRKRTV